MAGTSHKLSISVPAELAQAVRQRVGSRGVSGFVTRALAHELQREQLGHFLAALDAAHGPVPKRELAHARRAWPKR